MTRILITTTTEAIPENFSADISIVIDVLRASSVIIAALSYGCPFILPVTEIQEARTLKEAFPEALLAGERHAKIIPGFDRGNSPIEHQNNPLKQPVILTTTNGTRTLMKVNNSLHVAVAGFLNVDAIVDYILSQNFKDIHLACAGTNGQFSLDDFLMAGGIVSRLNKKIQLSDDFSLMAGRYYSMQQDNLHHALQTSAHYNTLKSLGYQADLDFCLQENVSQIVPVISQKEPIKISVRQIK